MIDIHLITEYPVGTDADLDNTLYQTYVKTAKKRLDTTAIYVFDTGKSYTHRELLNLVDLTSAGLKELGVDCNSRIGILLKSSIEDAITLLAVNKLGALCKYIDFMKSVPSMKHSIDETNLDLLIMDECFLPLEEAVNEKQLRVVVANSSNNYDGNHFISYSHLYENYNATAEEADYVKDKPTVIINSSGTTGEPKPIVHTDHSINAAAQKMLMTDYPIKEGNALIKMVPSQIGLGLVTSLYTGLLSGSTVVMVSGNSPRELTERVIGFVKDFSIFKKAIHLNENAKLNIFSFPYCVRTLVDSPMINDLSFVGSILAAGSKMTKEELDRLENHAKEKGCSVPICNGYGQNEMAGAVCLNENKHNVNGSAGFPTYRTKVIVIDPETKRILGPYETGLILESSNSEFLYYEGLEEKTRAAKVSLPDGSTWFNSYDMGYLDEKGFLYITGRVSRVVIRDDFKISLDDIERKIRAIDSIDEVATIVSEYGGSIEKIIAFVKPRDDKAEQAIRQSNSLSVYEMPSEIIIINDIPFKTSGKVDYQTLEEIFKRNNIT